MKEKGIKRWRGEGGRRAEKDEERIKICYVHTATCHKIIVYYKHVLIKNTNWKKSGMLMICRGQG